MKKRILALLLAVVLLTNTVPVSVLAEQAPVAPAEVSADPSAESPAGPGAEVMLMDEPEVEPEPQPEPCGTCGVVGCASEHLNWCDACKKDDCGVDHTAVVEPCSICKQENCTTQHEKCPVCPNYDCNIPHVYCQTCKIYDCGKTHVYCYICGEYDCGETHTSVDDSEYRANIGSCAVFDLTYGSFPVVSAPAAVGKKDVWSSSIQLSKADIPADLILVINNVYVNETEGLYWYEVKDATGADLPDGFPEPAWVFQNYVGDSYGDSLIIVEKPQTGCGCCADCTGGEDCDCGCEDCDFYKEPVLPDVPSEPSWGEDPYPELPSLYHPENEVAVYAEELPAGTSLVVEEADVTTQLRAFGVPASKLVFGLDISLDGYQTEALVKVAVSERPGTLIGILHTHGSKTTYIGTAEVLSDGTVEFVTDGFSEFAGFTVDFHYGGVDFSIEGMTSILLSELFEAMDIDEDAYDATSVVFSDPTLVEVTEEGNDWRLTSLKAFKTNETLVITFGDGHVTVVDVTDAQTAEYDYDASTTYHIPDNGDYITVWVDKDALPVDVKFDNSGNGWHTTFTQSDADPNDDYAEHSPKAATSKTTVTIAKGAPVGYKYGVRNGLRGRGIVRVVQFVTFRCKSTEISSTPTLPQNLGTNKKVGTWGMANTAENSKDRSNPFNISSTVPTAPGYTFKDWSYTDWQGITQTVSAGGEVRLDESSIVENAFVDFYANWIPNTNTKYTVKHYKQNLDGTYPITPTETQNLTGTTDATITPAVKSYTGFKSPATQTVTIDGDGDTVVEYKYERSSYTVTVNKGTGISTVSGGGTYKYGASVTIGATVSEGYTWKNWTGYDTQSAKNYTFTMPASPVTYTANATGNDYSVSFNGNGATSGSMTNQSFKFGTAQNLTANAYKREYTVTYNVNGGNAIANATAKATFNGWEDRGSIVYKGTTYGWPDFDVPYYANSSKSTTWPNGDIWGNFGYNKYRIMQHYVDHGKGEGRKTKDPNGVAWVYPDKAEVNNMSSTPNGEVSLYANWTLGSVTLPTPTKTGYTFKGWSDGTKTYAAGASYMPTANVTLTAMWTANSYTVSFDANANGEVANPQAITVTYDSEYGTLPDLTDTRVNYKFDGWYTAAIGGTNVTANTIYRIEGNSTLYAHWAGSTHTVTWKNWDGKVLETDTDVAHGTVPTYDSSLPQREGNAQYTYTFSGWSPVVSAATTDVTYTAQFTQTVNKYTVKFVDEDGTTISAEQYEYGTATNKITPDNPEKAADGKYTYTFKAWTPAVEKVTGNATYTATYTATPIPYTITYHGLTGSTGADGNPTSYHVETHDFTLTNPEKIGYTFDGWTGTNLVGASQSVTIAQGSTGHREYTATWTPNQYVYNVVYKSSVSGVTLGESTVEGTFDTTYEVAPPAIAGYTAPDAQNVTWNSVDAKIITFLYTPEEYTITCDLAGGTLAQDVTNPVKYKYTIETESFTLNNPTKAGYDFAGWVRTDLPEITDAVASVTIEQGSTGDREYTATWQVSRFDLTIITNNAVDDNQNYLFDVSGTAVDGTEVSLTVVLGAEDSQTIVGLPAGAYEVSDRQGWSWRYASTKQDVKYDQPETYTRTFTYTAVIEDKIYWLNGYNYGIWPEKKTKGGGKR